MGYSTDDERLKKVGRRKKLVRIGFGIYAKAVISKYTEKPMIKGGVDAAFYAASTHKTNSSTTATAVLSRSF